MDIELLEDEYDDLAHVGKDVKDNSILKNHLISSKQDN